MKDEKMHKVRHALSHLLAMSIKHYFPQAKLAIGPVIDDGFYYDVDTGDKKISEDDLEKLEEKIKEFIKQDLKFEKSVLSIDEAIAKEKSRQEDYKVELIEDLAKEGEKEVTYYTVGDFVDLCRGPHVESTKEIDPQAFKLNKVAGAYWRGDEKKQMLTRIYGLAFNNKKELKQYLNLLEEAKKRDHRKLGKELDLFHIDEKVGIGLPLWHPKGALLWRIIEDFWYNEHLKHGYDLVRSPHIGNRALWETSGHWGFYNDSMYPPLEVGQTLEEKQQKKEVKESEEYLLKPMNCPFHVQIYKNSPKSYKELPLRWAECGTVYRFEKKGELSGLTRVRGFTQDDAHIVCSEDQVENELGKVVDFILFMYKSFGFNIKDINVYLSVRDQENNKYAGDDKGWELTENILEKIAQEKKLNYSKDIGGAVFYGPKLDFKIKDSIGREWQCSTLQFDFNLPERFNMTYFNSKGNEVQPYMLHRALFGSFERFIGLLIEHYAGAFPIWFSPVQVKLVSVGESHIEYCKNLALDFKKENIRVSIDISSETVGNKIRKAVSEKVPYMLVIGDKEMEGDSLAIRKRGERNTTNMNKDEFISLLKKDIKEKN
ncbi:MAG TPA: threonine--tRNA ligase [Patescibacteria group bacterium]|nr:threonine--tRNA ligase [Patescibacteria group bacterium]